MMTSHTRQNQLNIFPPPFIDSSTKIKHFKFPHFKTLFFIMCAKNLDPTLSHQQIQYWLEIHNIQLITNYLYKTINPNFYLSKKKIPKKIQIYIVVHKNLSFHFNLPNYQFMYCPPTYNCHPICTST
jgi:hypothetical protein